MFFAAFPYLRWAVALLIGIVWQDAAGWDAGLLWQGLAISVAAYLSCWLLLQRRAFRWFNPLLGVFSLLSLVSVGMLLRHQADERSQPDHLIRADLSKVTAYRGWVAEPVSRRAKWYRTTLALSHIRTDTGWQPASGKVMLYLSREDSSAAHVRYEQTLLIKGHPFVPKAPDNPGQFDYQAYLARQQIFHQHFVRAGELLPVPATELQKRFSLYQMALHVRQWADSVLRQHVYHEDSYAIASALTLGIKDGLDAELKEAYAGAGAMHVLAVSGLHVGIIVMMLGFLFGLAEKRGLPKGVGIVVSLALLWAYALITGLSPSVLRAVTMFSLVLLGRWSARRISVYNSLGLSAFLLLCWQPLMAFEVGFQLSYCAVLGIVYFQPKFAALWQPTNRLLRWLWELSCVSLAAQLATFPIGIFYFQQFPTFFWLSNFFVIPGAYVGLLGSLLLLVFAWAAPLAWLLGSLVGWLFWVMNWLIFVLNKAPLAIINGLSISSLELIIMYGIILSMAAVFAQRNWRWIFVPAMLAAMLGLGFWQEWVIQKGRQSLVIYKAGKQHALALIKDQRAALMLDSALIEDKRTLSFSILPHLTAKGIRHHVIEPSQAATMLPTRRDSLLSGWLLGQKHCLMLRGEPTTWEGQTDLLIVSQKAIKSLAELGNIQRGITVLDGTFGYYHARRLKEEAKALGDSLHAVALDGAFVMEVNEPSW